MAGCKICSTPTFMFGFLGAIGLMSAFLFSTYLYKVMNEMGKSEASDGFIISDQFIRVLTMMAFASVFLSISTYAVLMLGIYRQKTTLMLPWLILTGFKCIAGGMSLIYLSFYIPSTSLLECLTYYSITVYSFIAIYFCYCKLRKMNKDREDKIVLTVAAA